MTYRASGTEAVFCNPDGPSVKFYHGTTALCAQKILMGGGFIAGPNGHRKAKIYFNGCFGSKHFRTAQVRGDPTRRLSETPDQIYTSGDCPCVLELEASSASIKNYKRGCPHLLVVQGQPGCLMPGMGQGPGSTAPPPAPP